METIAAAIIAALITIFVTSRISSNAALRGESIWREDLYKITKDMFITKDKVIYLRTFLSSLRGPLLKTNKSCDYLCDYDHDYKDDILDLDNLIISFCNYLFSENKFSNNFFYGGDLYLGSKEDFIFRQLCRLLLKSDWNSRNKSYFYYNDIKIKEPALKALIILNKYFRKEYENSENEELRGYINSVSKTVKRHKAKLYRHCCWNSLFRVLYIILLWFFTLVILICVYNSDFCISSSNKIKIILTGCSYDSLGKISLCVCFVLIAIYLTTRICFSLNRCNLNKYKKDLNDSKDFKQIS